jgi:hypothetical protein
MPCHTPFGAGVPIVTTASAVAKAIMAARQRPEVTKRYVLKVEPDEDGNWTAYQWSPIQQRGGEFIVTTGGGLAMTINRCTAEVTNLHGQR